MNIISNRFNSLNGKIELDWLNLSYIYYKIKLNFFLNVSFSIVTSSPVINEECCKNAKLKIIMHPKQSGIIVTKFLFNSKTSRGLTHSKWLPSRELLVDPLYSLMYNQVLWKMFLKKTPEIRPRKWFYMNIMNWNLLKGIDIYMIWKCEANILYEFFF